jgi:transposase-like protein
MDGEDSALAESSRRIYLQFIQMTPEESILQALAQADDDQASKILRDHIRGIVLVGLMRTMAAEVEQLCGPKYSPDKTKEFRRAGSEPGAVFVNGGKQKVTRPRVRTTDGQEVQLESYRAASDQRGLFETVVEAIAAGLPVRGVERCHGGAVKRTQASQMWIQQSRAQLEALRARSLVAEDWLALWIDGVYLGSDQCVIVAIGLHADGTKEVLDFEPGASESAEVCRLLLERITQRGFAPSPGRRLLVIRDDAKALKKGVSRMWPDAVQQECLVHAERVTLAKLPDKAKEEAVRLFRRLFRAQGGNAGSEAFDAILAHVANHNDEAASCLRERKEGLLAFHSLNVSSELNKVFLSTNMIENVIRNIRLATGSIKRWRTTGGSDMVSRWMAAGLMRAEQGFRRVDKHPRLGELAMALGTRTATGLAYAPEEVALAPSSGAPANPAAE